MKPKTSLQSKVLELSRTLPEIKDEHKSWAKEKCHDSYFFLSRKTVFCLDCSSSWKLDSVNPKQKTCVCPACGTKLKKAESASTNDRNYFSVLTTYKGFQVVRLVWVDKAMKKATMPTYLAREVMQHWVREDGTITTLSLKTMGLSMCYDQWILNSDLSITDNRSERDGYRFNLTSSIAVYPKKKIIPVIKRNGFKGKFYGVTIQRFFSNLLTCSLFETVLKNTDDHTIKFYLDNESSFTKYWSSFKLCRKNGYKIHNLSTWVDYLKLLEFFGKDLKSTKYICPLDLDVAHNRYVAKKRAHQKNLEEEALRQEIENNQIKYRSQKGHFFGIKFQRDDIVVSVVESVRDFMEHGDLLNHCIFTNEYYEKEESLILSASVSGSVVETIEVSLEKGKVLQARGFGNIASSYNKKIVKLVKENLQEIISIHRKNLKMVS